MPDNIVRSWLRRFFYVFIVKTVGKGHGSTLRTLFLKGYDISNKREGLNKGEYIICWGGGYHDRITYGGVVAVLRLYLLEQCPGFNFGTPKNS
jgi:hypothetical protein